MHRRRILALILSLSALLAIAAGQTNSPSAARPRGTRPPARPVTGQAGGLVPGRAHSAVLFLGDGMGLSTVNAASIYGYGRPGALFIQNRRYLGWSDTSSANNWVTDSAAGMTAIMTGRKTLNNVISQAPEGAVVGKEDGTELKTLLEYAEEKGLSTGLITNDNVTGATPAACYSHVNSRNKRAEIATSFSNRSSATGRNCCWDATRVTSPRRSKEASALTRATLPPKPSNAATSVSTARMNSWLLRSPAK